MAKKTTAVDFLGLGNNPSDIDSKDGNLALAINVLHEDGAIKNAVHDAPKVIGGGGGRHEAFYLHKINNEEPTHIIQRTYSPQDSEGRDRYLYLIMDADGNPLNVRYFTELANVDVKNVESLGNTLIFYSEDKVFYYLWKGNGYLFLGNDLPDVDIRFELEPHPYYYSAEERKDRKSPAYLPSRGSYKIYTSHSFTNGQYTFDYEGDPEESTSGGSSSDYTGGRSSQNRPTPDPEFSEKYSVFNPKDEADVTDGVFGLVNKFTGDWCNEKGYFSQPFFVRFALRLFDGTYTKHSSPILMLPTTGSNPSIPINYSYFVQNGIAEDEEEEGTTTSTKPNYMEVDCWGVGSELFYYLQSSETDLANWKDIIKGVDVFVSAPIYTYKQEKIKRFTIPSFGNDHFGKSAGGRDGERYGYSNPLPLEYHMEGDFCISSKFEGIWNKIGTHSNLSPSDFKLVQKKYVTATIDGEERLIAEAKDHHFSSYPDTRDITEEGVTRLASIYPVAYIHLPRKSYSEFDREVRDCSNFYLLKSYDLRELTFGNNRTKVDIAPGSLASIVTQEPLDDSFESHHLLIPNVTKTYNNRLNMASLKKRMFHGYSPSSMLQKIDGDPDINKPIQAIAIYLNKSGKEVVVVNRNSIEYDLIEYPYIFYPDIDAYKAVVFYGTPTDGIYNCLTYPMQEHKGLNGAFAYIGLERIKKNGSDIHYPARMPIPEESNDLIPYPNLIYTSEVNNPFVFKAKNVEQIGEGEIIAMAPTTLPLSQGQYGFAEMYCFTTDGIWALSVSNTGGWSAKQPFHYDVILNKNKNNLLQMERDILFSTDRGLMMLAGNKVDCITEIFNGRHDIMLEGKAWSQQFNSDWKTVLQSKIFPKVWNGADSAYKNFSYFEEFNKFVKNAIYLYDYPHQRVIIGNRNYTFSFVLNLKDKMWTSIPLKILSAVNSYPQCYATVYDEYTQTNLLVDFANIDTEQMAQPKNGLIVTRPIKLSSPTVQKTIRTINLQGQFDRKNTSMILLGCNDNAMKDWFVVSSCEGSRLPFRYGTPFKYFRLIVVTKLDTGESISGMMIEYEYKELNKERQ